MSDVYPFVDSDAEPSAAAFAMRNRQAASMTALNSLDASPEDAGRAQDLSQATGTPPALVYGDLENFEKQHKAAITASLFAKNQFLRDYVQSHPLAAKVSNDDWGQLDQTSEALQKLAIGPKIVNAAMQGWKEGVGEESFGPAYKALMALFNPIPTIAKTIVTGQMPDTGPKMVSTALSPIGRGVSGIANAVVQGGAEWLHQQFGWNRNEAERNIGGFAEFMMADTAGHGIEVPHEMVQRGMELHDAAQPWVEQGKVPPVGVADEFDQFHKEQAKEGMKALDDAMSEVQKSSTRERSPELMQAFIRQHTNAEIGIDAAAVRKLYGDKEPAPDDNLLGFVPGLGDQLRLAEAHGGDVNVPLADWLAKVDPEVAKELHDNIRVRDGGMTLEEAKGEAKPEQAKESEVASPEDQLVENEVRESFSDAYMDASPGESIIDTAIGNIKELIDSGVTHSPEGAPWARVLAEMQNKKATSPDATINARGDIIPRDPVVQALRDSTHLAEPLLTKLPQSKGIVPEQTEIGEVGVKGGSIPARTFPASDALAQVDKDRLTGVPRALAEFFSDRLQRMAGDTPVWLVDPEIMDQFSKDLNHPKGTPGFYHSGEHAIVMRGDYAQGAVGHSYAAHLLIHEVAHAATVREMEEFPELKGAVHDMLLETSAWLSDHEPQARVHHDYAFKNEHEFIAEAFSNPQFQEYLATTPISKELGEKLGLGGKIKKNVWDAVRGIVKNLISKLTGIKSVPDTILDGVLRLGPTFEEAQKRMKGDREGVTAAAKVPEQGELDVTRTEDKKLFDKANAIGLTEKQYARYMGLIEKRNAEDIEHQKAQTVARERERQTGEWKTNLARVHGEAQESIHSRPDIAADRFLREGHLYGEKIERRRLDETRLTPEQKAGLDPEHYGKSGLHPDDAAGLFGYTSGDRMVGQLGRLKQDRELEGLTPAAHLKRLVDVETERRMKAEYGNLKENILNEAKDNVLTQTQLDLLHEEMLALGSKAGGEISISKDDVKQWVKTEFNKTPLAAIDSDKYLAAAGRAGRTAEEALLAEKPQDAFKAKQQQYISVLLANEARRLEKLKDQDGKLRKKLSEAAPKGIDPEYAIWSQDIISRTGGFVKRTIQGIERQKELVSPAKDLRAFVEKVNAGHQIWGDDPDSMPMGQQMPVADFLLNPGYRKSIEEMTADEFRQVAGSLKTIDKNGRDFNKYMIRGEKKEIDEVVGGLVDRMKASVDDKRIGTSVEQPTSVLRTIGSLMLNPESWFKRLDLGNKDGPFSQLIVRPIMEGQYTKATLEREQAKEFRKIGDVKEANRKIDNPLFMDPNDNYQTPLALTRENLRIIMHNMGNELQRKKLAGGYGIKNPDDIWRWLFTVTKKEDWEPVQQMGEFFSKLFSKSEDMYSGLNGWVPDRIQLGTIQTPWGSMKEWYHPLIANPLFHGAGLKATNMMEESGYYRPSPASGYTKGRTGAVYPLDLTSRGIDTKIKQIINDIAMRPPITEVAKIALNPKFRDAFTQYYGKEYAKALEPWLKDSAGNRRYTPSTDAAVDSVINFIRENMSTLMIGGNFGTVLKHFPTALVFSIQHAGAKRFADEAFHILQQTETGQTRWQFNTSNSEELQNRLRSMKESVSASNQDMFRKYSWDHKFFTIRDMVQTIGAAPVAGSDLLSANIMWGAVYRREMEKEGVEHGDAVYTANTAVRQTHGSTITANRPAIMRMNPWVQSFMPYYNFFNNAANRMYEYGWKAKLAMDGRELPAMTGFEKEQYEKGIKHIPEVLGGFMTFGVMVSLIEQAVDPLPSDNKENPIKYGAKVIARGPIAMIPGLRDFMNAAWESHEASAGILGSFYSDITKPLANKGYIADPGKVFRRVNAIFGALTGMTYEEVGKIGQYIHSISAGGEHPRSFVDYYRGIRHGTQKVQTR